MNLASTLHTGLKGIAQGQQQMLQQAQSIAAPARDEADWIAAQINLHSSRQQIQASAKVVQAADRSLGHLLDIRV